MNRGFISDLAKCSNPSIYRYIPRVAAVFLSATLFVLTGISGAGAAVRAEGLSDWLTEAAERSLTAVYEHISADDPPAAKAELLRLVANRLLVGYSVSSVDFNEAGDVTVRIMPDLEPPDWEVALLPPNLSAPVDGWFAADVAGLREKLEPRMRNVPVQALTWGDVELKRVVEELCVERLPGWRVSLMVRHEEDASVLEVSFVPEQPLTLAVTSHLSSSSVPVMLHSNLKEDLLKGFAPVIGVPVPWLELHKEDLIVMSRGILAEEYIVDKGKIDTHITVKTGTLSELDVELESRRYAAWVWVAVYAGAKNKYPEAGLHFGRRAQIFPHWDMELYGELILGLDDWGVETRLGTRWTPWRYIWLGAEWSHPDDIWWLRASYDGRKGSPYAWLRYSLKGDTNGALGYRINEYLSIEVHYNSMDEDPWNVRALVNL